MRTYLTVQWALDGSGRVVAGPNGDYPGQSQAFKELISRGPDGTTRSVEIWASTRGVVKRRRFKDLAQESAKPAAKKSAKKKTE